MAQRVYILLANSLHPPRHSLLSGLDPLALPYPPLALPYPLLALPYPPCPTHPSCTPCESMMEGGNEGATAGGRTGRKEVV